MSLAIFSSSNNAAILGAAVAAFTSAGLTPVALSAAALKSILPFGSDFGTENGSWAGRAGETAVGIVSGAGGGAARGREGAARRGEREGFLVCEVQEGVGWW